MSASKSVPWVLAAAAVLAAGCGEKRDPGASVRKSDTSPSTGAHQAYTAPGWKAGDAASWEQHMRTRAQNQNEYLKTQTASQ